jgi:hypothetical protein
MLGLFFMFKFNGLAVNEMADQVATVETKETDKVGRPCKYESHVEPRLQEVFEWLKQGYTDYSIAEQLGIHETTWIKYKADYPNLSSLYTRAIHERNRLVMNRMFSKACGEVAQVKQQKLDKDNKVVTLTSEIYTPPDVNAADLFLRNNDPEYKSAKAETGNLTLIQANINIPQIEAELEQIRQQRLQMAKVIEIED